MGNHFHLLVTAPDGNLSAAMLYFMRETSREVSRRSGKINQTWGMWNRKTVITNELRRPKFEYRTPKKTERPSPLETEPL